MNSVTVKLMGEDRTIHSQGELSSKLLSTIKIIERNKRLYVFSNFKNNIAEFEESQLPYTLTEW